VIVALLRTALVAFALLLATPIFAGAVIAGGLLGVRNRPGSVFDWSPRNWARVLLWAAGVRVTVHGDEHRRGARHVFVGNHVSWFDVFAMAAHLRRFKFVAKAELFRIPLFGRAMRVAGMIPIERQNQSRARASIHQAGAAIEAGASVILFPEGTRGRAYTLRPFKKGAFVLAIETQAPIVPVAIHGTLEVLPKGTALIRPGRVDLHFLPPIETAGTTYADRDALAAKAERAIGECLTRAHGVESVAGLARAGK
jgi:1-acyl-sn-glycerol-3-phosphate acyltransferase